MQVSPLPTWLTMDSPERLVHLRKHKQLTQQGPADLAGVSLSLLKRYESGKAQPTLPVLRRLAIALGVSGDALLFEKGERGPGDDLCLHFEAVSRMSPEEQRVVRSLLEGMILKHDAKRWNTIPAANAHPPCLRQTRPAATRALCFMTHRQRDLECYSGEFKRA